ncbi:MAG: phosphoribosylglycinamide formyltransferase [Desulfovibrio sp.]|nr:phosphoribosylglycinamide formyltransferase [Desulfovibrio sp.]
MACTIAILASGNGTNAQAMIDKIAFGALDATIALIICNRPGAGVIQRAAKAGIPCLVLDHRQFADRESFDMRMAEELRAARVQWIVLAGYMRLLSPAFLQAFRGRVINIHPALLPSFPGLHGGADALAYGVKISGCTVHFVEEQVDSGPVIIQAAVPVHAQESVDELMQRIHAMEHRIYPQAVQWLAEGRIAVVGRQVCLTPGSKKPASRSGDWLVWPPLEEGF